MPTEGKQGFPYPASSASPNVPVDIQALAQAVANRVVQIYASSADRATKQTAPVEGMISWLQDTNLFYFYSGSAWVPLIEYPGARTSVVIGAGQPGPLSFSSSWCSYQKLGRAVTVHGDVTFNATGTGSTVLYFSIVNLPTPRRTDGRNGSFWYFDSGSAVYSGVCSWANVGGTIEVRGVVSVGASGTEFGAGPNVQVASPDRCTIQFEYEANT